MKEKKFQETIRQHRLTEFPLKIELEVRVGDLHPGWAMNNVEATIREILPKHGIMVDNITFRR